MQRVRIGLTGLGFVFIMVLLAAVFTSHSSEEPLTSNLIEQSRTSGAAPDNETAEPEEPLAELGVAPGNADSQNAQSNLAQPSRPR